MGSAPPAATCNIVAALGPTNTGKTYRAIERMLEHESGMMGLPLRLLAREVYDRVTARIGEERVALVTGEEKRIPRRPDYWIATVEAMPMDVAVDFLAVDEIQLSAHRERGHVFTDRLLHARGRRETWFLGSDTARTLVETLVPDAWHQRYRRLSRLRHAGSRSLRSLPPRSALVAFSVAQVYEIAERVRRLRGGVAVVLGALSPRTRNAQVAMYQAGEVQYLVATDAIGMGLNLDVDHIAFAALRKFDGREHRGLGVAELAQIAGRAGRHLNDGTFGTVRPIEELDSEVAYAVESHRFRPLDKLVWRNSDLHFSTVDALLESLVQPPGHPALRRVEQAEDHDALKALNEMPEIRARANDPRAVALLWDVCQIPDFRKLLLLRHVGLLREIFLQLREGEGHLDETWLAGRVKRVDDLRGGIDELTARLAQVRTWTYVAHRGAWLADPEHWRERTRAIEDALGDALHERLVERFVERSGRGHARPGRSRHGARPPPDPHGPFAALRGLADALSGEAEVESEEMWVSRVTDAPHEDFDVHRNGRVVFEGEAVGRLSRGPDLLSASIALVDADGWSAGARRRIERRLVAFARDLASEAAGGFRGAPGASPDASADARGLAYRLSRGLGAVPNGEAHAQWRALSEETRERFADAGVREGARYLYVRDAFTPRALERRAVLVSLSDGPAPAGVPAEPAVDARLFRDADHARLYAYELLGGTALRIDLVERLLAVLGRDAGGGDGPEVLESLALAPDRRKRLLSALGFREGESGVVRLRRRRRRRRRRKQAG